jgi:hypothetical protein
LIPPVVLDNGHVLLYLERSVVHPILNHR